MAADLRLLPAYELVEAGKVEVLSLDVFDTLLWRKVPSYQDLFFLLGCRLKKQGWLIPAVTPENFVDLRMKAEKKARKEKRYPDGRTEVTLPEIYWHLQSIFTPLTTEQMIAGHTPGIYEGEVSSVVRMEEKLDRELIAYDAAVVQLISYARQKNIPVILVSDTYYEEKQMRELLHPYLNSIHRLFLSCEYGIGKREGLFQIVIEELGVSPEKILHIGDNEKSDVQAGREAGLTTLHFPKYPSDFEEVLKEEWGESWGKRGPLLDANQGDFGFTLIRSKMAYHPDLLQEKGENRFFWKYGAMVLGPILLGFVHWIYTRCHEMGQKEVFCLMREGKLYAELLKRHSPYYPAHALEPHPLWVSRPFIIHASMGRADGTELVDLMKTFLEQFTVETFCHYLGLEIGKMGKWSSFRHVVLEDPRLKEELIHDLLKRREWRKRIVDHAAQKRERFLKYLSGVVDLSHERQMILVDSGWGGTTQGGLHRLLQLNDAPIQLYGLYLGTSEAVYEGLLKGLIREGYLFRGGYPSSSHAYKKGCFVLEQCATAETGVGPLADIDKDGKAITHPTWVSSKQKKQASIVQQGIFAFFDYVGHHIRSGEIVLDSHSEALQYQLRTILLRSMTNATHPEAVKFGPWRHEHGPTHHLTQVIGRNAYYDDFIQDMAPAAALKESGLNWPSAYTAKQSKYLTLATQAVWLETLPARCFLSEDQYPLKVYLDTGRNFPQKANQSLALRSNANRRFYTQAKLFSSKKGMQRIRLVLTFPSSCVRLISLRMAIFDRSRPECHEIALFEGSSLPKEIVCEAEGQLDFNTFYCGRDLTLTYDFNSASVYHVKLKLCCEVFTLEKSLLKWLDSHQPDSRELQNRL